MLQAAVRGLDTVADFAAKLKPGVLKIDKFVVTGASKVRRAYVYNEMHSCRLHFVCSLYCQEKAKFI